jgi:hypothetical protein
MQYCAQVEHLHAQVAPDMPIGAFVAAINPQALGFQSRDQLYAPVEFAVQIAGPLNGAAGAIRVKVPVHANPDWLPVMKHRFAAMIGGAVQAQSLDFRTVDGRSISTVPVEQLHRVGKLHVFVQDKELRLPQVPSIPIEYSVTKMRDIDRWITDTVEEKLPALVARYLAPCKNAEELQAAVRGDGPLVKAIEGAIQGADRVAWAEFVRTRHVNAPMVMPAEEANRAAHAIASDVLLGEVRRMVEAAAPQIKQHFHQVESARIAKELTGRQNPDHYAPIAGLSAAAPTPGAEQSSIENITEFYRDLAEDIVTTPHVREAISAVLYTRPMTAIGCRWKPRNEPGAKGGDVVPTGGSTGGKKAPKKKTKSSTPRLKQKFDLVYWTKDELTQAYEQEISGERSNFEAVFRRKFPDLGLRNDTFASLVQAVMDSQTVSKFKSSLANLKTKSFNVQSAETEGDTIWVDALYFLTLYFNVRTLPTLKKIHPDDPNIQQLELSNADHYEEVITLRFKEIVRNDDEKVEGDGDNNFHLSHSIFMKYEKIITGKQKESVEISEMSLTDEILNETKGNIFQRLAQEDMNPERVAMEIQNVLVHVNMEYQTDIVLEDLNLDPQEIRQIVSQMQLENFPGADALTAQKDRDYWILQIEIETDKLLNPDGAIEISSARLEENTNHSDYWKRKIQTQNATNALKSINTKPGKLSGADWQLLFANPKMLVKDAKFASLVKRLTRSALQFAAEAFGVTGVEKKTKNEIANLINTTGKFGYTLLKSNIEAHHPWNAMIHHNAQPTMGGAYPDYYNAMHTKQDMTAQAPYIGDAADTYRSYHLFGGVPVAPLVGLERIGCHVGRHRKHCEDTAAKLQAIHERARGADQADRDVDIDRDSDAFRKQVRGNFGVNSELPPLVPLVRAPISSSSSKAPPVVPISSKAPPVLPLGNDLPPLVPLVRAPSSSKAPPVLPIDCHMSDSDSDIDNEKLMKDDISHADMLLGDAVDLDAESPRHVGVSIDSRRTLPSSLNMPPLVPIGKKAPSVLPIDCHMSSDDEKSDYEGVDEDISRAQMLLGSMFDDDHDDFVPVRASVASRVIPPCPPTIALIEAEEDENPFGMPTLAQALAKKK